MANAKRNGATTFGATTFGATTFEQLTYRDKQLRPFLDKQPDVEQKIYWSHLFDQKNKHILSSYLLNFVSEKRKFHIGRLLPSLSWCS